MELAISSEDLFRGLQLVYRVSDRRSSMPVLANVLIDATNDGVCLSTTDLCLGASSKVKADVSAVGKVTVNAKRLHDIAKRLPDGSISLSTTENAWLSLRKGRLHYELAGIPAEEFPRLPTPKLESVAYSLNTLSEGIRRVVFAALPDEGRPHLNAVNFIHLGGLLTLVATDGHRLSLVKTEAETIEGEIARLLPLRAVKVLEQALKYFEGDVGISSGDDEVFFDFGSGSLLVSTKLTGAAFPPYEKIIPKLCKQTTKVERLALLAAVERVVLISDDSAIACKMTFGDGEIEVSTENPDSGLGSDFVSCSHIGDKITLAFNSRYLIEALNSLEVEDVMFNTSGPTDAAVITVVGEKDQLSLIMPMRL